MRTFEFDRETIDRDFEKAENILFEKENIMPVNYENFNCNSFDNLNQKLLSEISGNSVVYCIWVDGSNGLIPLYVGHVDGKYSRQRIRNHLTKKNENTGAKLDYVVAELENQKKIGISWLKIEPAYMRKVLEDWLIVKNANETRLTWNKVGRKKRVK